ncbi:MAG: capsular polysaccharide export protein, partial [Gammaproteobacteria bacterium]
KKYLLVPFQKDRDSQILDNSKWIKSMRQMFAVLLEALEASGRDDLHIVFREHPSAKTKYSDLYKQAAKHPRLCFDQQSDLTEIITNAEAVVTINSTVGLESLLLDTKVITLGEAFYNVSSLVLSASSPSDLATQINALSGFSLDRKLLQQFVGYLESDYVIAGDWKKPDEQHFDSIRQRFFDYLTPLPSSYKATA